MKVKIETIDHFLLGDSSIGITIQTAIIGNGAQIQHHFEIRLFPLAIFAQINRELSISFGITIYKLYFEFKIGRILK